MTETLFDVHFVAIPLMGRHLSGHFPGNKENDTRLSARDAVALAARLVARPLMGRVFIVDCHTDYIVFDWNHAHGIVFPPE